MTVHHPTIVFSHANGFPAGTYRVLFERWRAAGFEVRAVEKFGHDPAYPVTSNWPKLRDELIDFIDREVGHPAFLVGHSLGGVLSLLAACKRPDLAQGLVLLDSPVIVGWRAHSIAAVKATRLIHRISPGKVSQTRRHEWPSAEVAHQHFAAKRKFARWDPRVLADYIACGIETTEEGARLAFTREVETRIYNTLPHHVPAVLRRRPLKCPFAFIAGTRSRELRQGGVEAARAMARDRFVWMEGSHLYPMEKPDQTADEVLRLIRSMPAAQTLR
jgi:pimeloyl-ACP methyl ester carboxylesterase